MAEDRGFSPVFHLHAALPPAWLEIGRFFGEVGVLSVWPVRSYCAILQGAIPSGIRWGAGAFFGSASAAPSAQGQQPGSSWCWKGEIFRGWRIFAVSRVSTAPVAAPLCEKINKTLRQLLGFGVCSNSGSTYLSNRYLAARSNMGAHKLFLLSL